MVKSRRKNVEDVEAQPLRRRSILPEAFHGAAMDDPAVAVPLGCCGLITLGAFIGLIVLLCSITTLGPEEQVVIEGADGKYVLNGPRTSVLSPSRKKTFRKATRLGPREYAVIKNSRTGVMRHEAGPKLLWLEAYDENVGNRQKIVLQLQEYITLIDKNTGAERVVVGPQILIPNVLEQSPNGTEAAIVLSAEITVLVNNITSGLSRLITEEGVFTPAPYERILEVRTATLLGPQDYALVKNTLNGVHRNEVGPKLLKIGAYDDLISVSKKIVLEKDQYVRLKKRGTERVVKGPASFVPDYMEKSDEGVQRATFLDTDTAVIVRNMNDGQQRLVTTKGVFMPGPYELVAATRNLIRVLPQEAILVRDSQGMITIHNGAEGVSAFFLPPYTEVVENMWSDYSEPPPVGQLQKGDKVKRTKIDLRTQKVFFRNEVRTSDNVKLSLDGTVFWRIVDIGKMVNTTGDPEGDVWHHSRSALIQAVSKNSLNGFMANFNNISNEAFQLQANDAFYLDRGVELSSMELTRFECVDESTALILQQIIQETVNRINRLQVQESENEVKAAALSAEIQLELQRKDLITTKAENERLLAEMAGDVDGMQIMRSAATFIGGLNESVPDVDKRVELYEMHERLKGKNKDTLNLAAGNAKLFLTSEDVNLKG